MTDTCVLLYSSLATDQLQVVNSRRLEDVLIGKRIRFEKVDGSIPESKALRDQLFELSQARGKYPQCFIRGGDSTYTFIGLWDVVESLVEYNTLPPDVLQSNPSILTFDQVTYDADES